MSSASSASDEIIAVGWMRHDFGLAMAAPSVVVEARRIPARARGQTGMIAKSSALADFVVHASQAMYTQRDNSKPAHFLGWAVD
jgi:hypothetical protein